MAADVGGFGYLGVELVHYGWGGLIDLSSDSLEEFVELTDLVLDDLGVVYYNVQWISHFVGDRRVDESY